MTDIARARTIIPIHKGPVNKNSHQDTTVTSNHEDRKEAYTLNNMQKSMEDELEKKRQEWEQEVKQMQQDFFQMQTNPKDTKDGKHSPELVVPGREVIRCSRSSPLKDMEDGTKKFCQNFDVKDFDADDINIRVEGRKLFVEGRKETEDRPGRKSEKRFSRQVDIPPCVDIDQLSSFFSRDGTLTVEAPIEEMPPPSLTSERYEALPAPPDYYSVRSDPYMEHHYTNSYPEHNYVETYPEQEYVPREIYPSRNRVPAGNRVVRHHEISLQPKPLYHSYNTDRSVSPSRKVYVNTSNSPARSMFKTITPTSMLGNMKSSPTSHVTYSSSPSSYSPNSMFSRFTSPSVVTVNETKKLKFNVDVGHDFDPEDITVVLNSDGRHVKVHAAKEQVIGGRTSKREFSRQFDLPEEVESSTLRASVDAHGRLYLGASVSSNTDHMAALQSVMQDLPNHATPVRVEI